MSLIRLGILRRMHISFRPETPFDSIESAQQFVELSMDWKSEWTG